jgi:hypothetical protein
MIVAHIKHHGKGFMPVAADALMVISEEDLQRQVVQKFMGLQKGLWQVKVLDSNNKHIIKTAARENIGKDNDSLDRGSHAEEVIALEKKPNIVSLLASRAKGVHVEIRLSDLRV